MSAVPIRTGRLLLRPWRASDRQPFAALNADPVVMEHFPSILTREESDVFADSIATHLDEHGWGTYAVEVIDGPDFVGYVGLAAPEWLGATEVRWRLAREHWGHGYATEGARAAVADGFARLGLDEIVAITVPANAAHARSCVGSGCTTIRPTTSTIRTCPMVIHFDAT